MPEFTPEKHSAATDKAAVEETRLAAVPTGDTHDLAVMLESPLRESCSQRLGQVEWFRSTWQHGGAATGFSTWAFADGSQIEVIVKLPVGPKEYAWTVGLGTIDHDQWETDDGRAMPVPRVVAAGETLGGYDLAWIIIERLAGPALNHEINEPMVKELLHTAAEFHAAASSVRTVDGQGEERDWHHLIARSREALDYVHMPDTQRWREMLHKLERGLKRVLRVWEARPRDTWCHGDLHPGNAMRRDLGNGDRGRCVLLDLAFVHPGHWVEDAVYIERQFWAHPEVLGKTKPVSEMGRRRRALGLEPHGNHGELAAARRVLMAGCVPAWWESEGTPAYAKGAMDVLDRHLHMFAK
ncbi:hypothetical protein MNBD_PLANCTO03-2250 [hydrothermal vent metagenome]|uniref:Aminoglycoside phosphotransferase domain-containing protein n=1 Tax=hydrothermal vent metagenome TaxID=652676 RepID=A0A3B1DSR8_9ZZZZ